MNEINLAAKEFSSMLNCPCGMGNLHQHKYEVFNRTEDSTNVIKTVVKDSTVAINHIPNQGSGNPSARRDGIKVHFWCEGGHDMVLNIYQHKGITFLDWEKDWNEHDA